MLPRVLQLFCNFNFMHCLFATSNFCSYYSELFFVHYALFRLPKYLTFAVITWSSFPLCAVYIAEIAAHPIWIDQDLWHLSKHLKSVCVDCWYFITFLADLYATVISMMQRIHFLPRWTGNKLLCYFNRKERKLLHFLLCFCIIEIPNDGDVSSWTLLCGREDLISETADNWTAETPQTLG